MPTATELKYCPRCGTGAVMSDSEPFCLACGWRKTRVAPVDDISLGYTTKNLQLQERNEAIFARFMAGETLARLSQAYDLTPDYVSDIIRQMRRKSMGAGSTWNSRMPGVHARSKHEKPLRMDQILQPGW